MKIPEPDLAFLSKFSNPVQIWLSFSQIKEDSNKNHLAQAFFQLFSLENQIYNCKTNIIQYGNVVFEVNKGSL